MIIAPYRAAFQPALFQKIVKGNDIIVRHVGKQVNLAPLAQRLNNLNISPAPPRSCPVCAHHGPLFYILIVLIVLAVIVAVLRLLYCRKLKKAVAAGTMTEEEAATLRKQGLRMWLGEERAKLQAKLAAVKEAKEAMAEEAETAAIEAKSEK